MVIDDDPTGTQSVHGVPVLTAWSREDLAGALQDAGTVFVLTNSRSLPEREAIAISTEIAARAVAIAAGEEVPQEQVGAGPTERSLRAPSLAGGRTGRIGCPSPPEECTDERSV